MLDARREIKEAKEQIEQYTKELNDSRPAYDKMKAELSKIGLKATDYTTTKATRQKWDKRYREMQPEWNELRDKVEFAPARIKAREDVRDTMERILGQRIAALKPTVVKYAENQAAHPNLIAPGKIDERIERYKVGDAKIKEITKLGERSDKVDLRLVTRRGEHQKIIDGLVDKQGKLIGDAEAAGGLTKQTLKDVDAIQKDIDAAVVRRDKVKATQRAVRDLQGERVARVIEAETPITFKGKAPDAGAITSNKGVQAPLAAPTPETERAIDKATKWLSRVVEKGDGDFATQMELKIGEAPGVRAHFATTRPTANYNIQVQTGESVSTVVHEYGHAIDAGVKVGDESILKRSLEFKAHRLKGETPIELNTKFPWYDPGERGAADEFGKAMPESHAYYTGKDYGDGATEIVSMGLQLLYEHPVQFARQDPQFCKYILGILDGSLR